MSHHCKISVAKGYATDSSAWPVSMTDACKSCQGCESSGSGMTSVSGIRLESDYGRTVLAWACPACKVRVIEKTTALSADAHAQSIQGDLLCARCRQKAVTPPSPNEQETP